MIKRIYDGISERLTDSYYGKKIKAAFLAYGAAYDFCKFYACEGDGCWGTVHIYNFSMVIDGNCDPEDILILANMARPVTIEVSSNLALQLPDDYERRSRTLFMGKPGETDIRESDIVTDSNFEECYAILKESFENFGSFDQWYVDISHRIRHGVSGLYLWNSTTVTKCFDIDGFVFVSGIATAERNRGKGCARRVLRCLAEKFEKERKNLYLFALEHRRTFYESIGFVPVGGDILYERKGDI